MKICVHAAFGPRLIGLRRNRKTFGPENERIHFCCKSLTALGVREAVFYAVVKGGRVGLFLTLINMDLGVQVTDLQRIL